MKMLKSILMASGALFAFATLAQAADLPTKKGVAPPPEKPNCYATFWSWLELDAGGLPAELLGHHILRSGRCRRRRKSNHARFNKARPEAVQELVSKQSHGAAWQGVPNGLSQSNVGIKWKEQVVPDWYFIGDVNAGFDPYSLQFANGPRSLAENSTVPQINQTANAKFSRAYGPINARAYAGIRIRRSAR